MSRMNAKQSKPVPLMFCRQCQLAGLPIPDMEVRFHPERRWRFDYCWAHLRLAMEVEGGAFVGGRHTRGAGFVKDLEKYTEAAILGYRIIRVTPKQVKNGEALTLVQRALKAAA